MGKKQNVRRRPPNTLTKERQKTLADSVEARAQSLKNDAENGNASRTADNPDVGRPEKPKDLAKPQAATSQDKGVDDVS